MLHLLISQDYKTLLVTLACLFFGFVITYKWFVGVLRKLAERDEERRFLSNKHAQTSLWREILKLIDETEENTAIDFDVIEDKFSSLDDVSAAIKKAGLESSNLIIGIDFTASNEWQGRKSFEHRSLHHIFKNKRTNPYQKVICSIAETLAPFDNDNLIPVYGFGDKLTKDHSVFSFCEKEASCRGFQEVLRRYGDIVQNIELSGPTSFAPIINKAIEITKEKNDYHILLIIADGQVVEEQELATRRAIVEASAYPLSIILVGVGDGPWGVMSEYDEKLPKRKFDNFQFVDYHKVTKKAKNPELAFALNALMEIPDQYQTIKKMGLI